MSPETEKLVEQIDHSLKAAQRDFDLLKKEIKKRDETHPGQPVGWGNEAEIKFFDAE